MMKPDLYAHKYYINREFSWLEFNRRVLDEACDPSNPLLERVKFLAICYGNLDEFHMIRLPGLIIQSHSGHTTAEPDNIEGIALTEAVSERVSKLMNDYEECWNELKEELAKERVRVKRIGDLTTEQKKWTSDYFATAVYPLLTPLALDISHPFPFISSNAVNIAVKMKKGGASLYARVKVPTQIFPRFIELPSQDGMEFILLDDIIKDNISDLFPGMDIVGAYIFRVTRNADVKVTIDEACDLLSAVEMSIGGRDTLHPASMMVESEMPKEMCDMFGRNLKLLPGQIYSFKELPLSDLWQIANLNIPKLKEKSFVPFTPAELSDDADMFEALKKKDRILFHPYESFNTIVRFIQNSATDPHVKSIKMSLYRIGKDPAIINALKKARERGKNVSVLMELRAKFDETNNIQWARELEAMGVHVVYGPVDLKVHAKMLQVVRMEGNTLVRYTHLSSGNYNISTAKQYGDISFLTANKEIGDDVGELFNALTGYFGPRKYKRLIVAPTTLKDGLIKKIEREIEHSRNGRPSGIKIKANGLVEADVIATMYKASMAGVKIDLNIRGLCCLRPGVKGVSENIRVTSIVDRFLEHSRIYYFENGGDPEMLTGSADMMPRNMAARVEILFPVLDKAMMQQIKENILEIHLADNVKAKQLTSDGVYVRMKKTDGPLRSQDWFVKNRGKWHA